MSQKKDASVKRTAEPNLFAAPLSSTEDQPKPKITGRPQTAILIWSLLIVPLTLSAFFGTLVGGFWLAENEFIAIGATITMLCAMVLAISTFVIVLLWILNLSRRGPQREEMYDHQFGGKEE